MCSSPGGPETPLSQLGDAYSARHQARLEAGDVRATHSKKGPSNFATPRVPSMEQRQEKARPQQTPLGAITNHVGRSKAPQPQEQSTGPEPVGTPASGSQPRKAAPSSLRIPINTGTDEETGPVGLNIPI